MATATHANRISELRSKLAVSQKVLARMLGVTERTVIDLERGGRDLSESIHRRATELSRLCRELAKVVRRESIGRWLTQPNSAFDGDAPTDVIASGKIDLLWQMIFELRSGVAS
jgi:DNA-binding XRE family transcriptional regulator